MKNIVIGICSVALILIIMLTAYTLYGRSLRQTEINNALASGMEKAMSLLQEEGENAPESDEELIAFFMEAFTAQVDSSSDLTVHVLDADFQKGLLSVEAVMSFRHPMGGTGKVAAKRTMILEQYKTGQLVPVFKVQFFSEGRLFKQYTLKQGSKVPKPPSPLKEGTEFETWKEMENGSAVDIDSLVVLNDLQFTAVFH